MKNTLTALIGASLLVGAVGAVQAATLAAQSIICDSLDDLRLLERPNLKGQLPAEAFKRVRLTIELYESMAQFRKIDGWREREADLPLFRSFDANCALSTSMQQVEITERRAIGGIVRVRTLIRGASSDVWTQALSVSE